MADKAWSFLFNMDGFGFYSAAQAGGLTGIAPFSFGVVFALAAPQLTDQSIFGNTAVGTATGCAIRVNATAGQIEAANGTVLQPSGTALADADGTYSGNEQNLLNNYKSALTAPAAVVGATPMAWPSPEPYRLIHMHCDVPASGNQNTAINGRRVAQTAVGLATNSNPFRIGIDSATGNGAGASVFIMGCYYNGAVFSPVNIATIYNRILQAKDVGSTLDGTLDYIWSVKRGNPDGRDNWVSSGKAATPITMALTGTLSANTAAIYDLPPA